MKKREISDLIYRFTYCLRHMLIIEISSLLLSFSRLYLSLLLGSFLKLNYGKEKKATNLLSFAIDRESLLTSPCIGKHLEHCPCVHIYWLCDGERDRG